ncbi:hypothetical protein CHS0354_017617 [Potamilus streckersoni]|uniref:RCC1-like domain-containing protein n=1 Tax=Potamilus streckersoni TaxID=2493646 RepID=A0AAE0RNW1_9BIVA|nr:hypothetical protein CHS0354_017617 [Potamilus streckersoni]
MAAPLTTCIRQIERTHSPQILQKLKHVRGTLTWSCLVQILRNASYATIRLRKQEQRKNQIFQYAGEDAKGADRIYVWGNATTGALGIKTYLRPKRYGQHEILTQKKPARLRFMDVHKFKVLDVACGYGFTVFAVKSNTGHKILGCGINSDSQIGFHEEPKNSGRILEYIIQPAVIDLPQNDPATLRLKQVACGRAHTLILTEKHGVFSLGNNAYGQCGRGIVEGEIFSKKSSIYKIPSLPENITKVVCGQDHSFFLTETGEVYSCGLGADGQTGLGHYKATGIPSHVVGDIRGEKIIDIASAADCVLAISEKGDLFGWGNSEYSQLSVVTDATQVHTSRHLPFEKLGKIVKACAGGSICGILNDQGQVFVWGFGILGKGPNLEMADFPREIPPTLFGRNELQTDTKVVDINCGLSFYAALTDKGDLYTWGKNKWGCLGLIYNKDQYFPLKVSLPAESKMVRCGVDHMVVHSKSYC